MKTIVEQEAETARLNLEVKEYLDKINRLTETLYVDESEILWYAQMMRYYLNEILDLNDKIRINENPGRPRDVNSGLRLLFNRPDR